MVILEFSFPAKRFHTTPWGSHVNEGVVEWPPSPWRILRALIATWHLKCKKEIPEQTMREIINELSQKPPSYYLPPASLGHTQHYMPKIEGPNEKKTKIYDTFVNVSDPIKVCWDIDISKEKRNALKLLCSRLGYLGRAESVVEATVSDDIDKTTLNSYPLDEGKPIPDKMELIRLLSPMDNGSYENWKNNYNIGESSSTAKNSGKKSTKGRSKGKK
ncbi:MAG TPA: type I-U CRISPR-associated protein Csb2, partial [Verrucomicrobiota bacterium]|nr:type I-U CRISPR-associated protein Csb2 [Verrucomicrobiota bacterium]